MHSTTFGIPLLRPALLFAVSLACSTAQAQVIDFSSSRGAGISQSDVMMENIRIRVPVPNPFDPGSSTTVENSYNVRFRFDPTTLHLVPVGIDQTDPQQACASATVSVFDAVRGAAAPIANASVTLGNQTLQTNAQGQVSFSGLPASTFTINAAASDYVPASQAIALSCDTPASTAIALSPSNPNQGGLGAGQFRIILTWGQDPADLDSHLTGPGTTADSRFHVFYANKTNGGVCGLDVDDLTSFGPETVTCPSTGSTGTLRPGVYRYSVHHYSGLTNIGASGASVRLEFANGQQYRFTPPALSNYLGRNDVWTVFELTVNSNGAVSMAPVDSVMNNVGSGQVRSGDKGAVELAAPQFGRAEDMSLMRGLSK